MVGPYPEPGNQVSGGVERVIDTLLPELAGYVDLILIVPGANLDAESVNHGVRTIYLKRGPGPGAARYWTIDARRLSQVVEKLAPDIVHLQGVAGVGRLVASPQLLTVHGIVHRDILTSSRGKGWGPLVRLGMAQVMRIVEASARRRIGHVITINPYVREALPDIGALRTFSIPNPVDPAFLTPLPDTGRPREHRIISIGRVGPLKNTLGILRIAAAVMRRNASVSLALYGDTVDGEYKNRCLELIRKEGLEGRIAIKGNVTSTELSQALDCSSCLIMASRQESAPMAITEAHARGVAVVAPEAFGIKYMITPGKNGFFLPAEDLETQADVLRRTLDHDWDRAVIALEAWESYSPRNVAVRTLAAYRDVLAASGARTDTQ